MLPLCQISFFFVASTAELAHGENRVLDHSPSLFDAPGTEACAFHL